MANPATPEQRLTAYRRNRPAASRSNYENELVKIAMMAINERNFQRQLVAALREIRNG